MEYSNLYDLISGLSYGTKLHIGVLFFGHYGHEKLVIPYKHTIHTSAICNVFKNISGGYPRCYRCRNAAIEKALHTQKPFGGLCINGVYEYTRPVTEHGNTICIIFIGNILSAGTGQKKIRQQLSDNKELTDTKELLDTMEENFTYEQCEVYGILLESYIRMLLDSYPNSNIHSDFNPLIENLKNYMEDNLEYDIDITRLAKNFHYNEKYLGRLFKQKTGMSFREYINHRRIEHAKNLLRTSDETIINISAKCGFNNVTYFNRIFKKVTGLSPKDYRNKNC